MNLTKEQKARFDALKNCEDRKCDPKISERECARCYVKRIEQFLASELDRQKSEAIRAINSELRVSRKETKPFSHMDYYVLGLEIAKKIISEEK